MRRGPLFRGLSGIIRQTLNMGGNAPLEPTRFADLLGEGSWNKPMRGVAEANEAPAEAPAGAQISQPSSGEHSFAPLATSLGGPDTLETLAPTTPSEGYAEHANEEDKAPPAEHASGAARTDPRVDVAQQAGDETDTREKRFIDLPGIAFQVSGAASSRSLLSREQATAKLAAMGAPANLSAGFHLLPAGGAIVVRQENGYTLQRVDGECVKALRERGHDATKKFAEAVHNLMQSQQIAHLRGVMATVTELQASGIINCSSSRSYATRLQVLTKSLEEWAGARNKVARLLHQTKSRQLQLQTLQKQLDTLRDVLGKGEEELNAAVLAENAFVNNKKGFILSLAAELGKEASGLINVVAQT